MLQIKRSELKQLAQKRIGSDSIEAQNKLLVMVSTAMAARTSYTVVGDEKEFGYEKQIELHDRMANQVPFHASPFEHCARAMGNEEYVTNVKGTIDCLELEENDTIAYLKVDASDRETGWSRNFKGFVQYREILEAKHNE